MSSATSHPEIKLVSRDRGGDYASAATAGAPQAVESRRSLPRVEEFGGSIGGVSLSPSGDQTKDPNAKNACRTSSHRGSTSPSQAFSPSVERLQQAYREERVTRYEQVVALRKLGMSHTAIAERVGMGESTESLWLAAGAYPETTRGPYVSRIDPYLPYLFQRWESGCHNMVRLHQELLAQGYRGSYASVRDHLVRRLHVSPIGVQRLASPKACQTRFIPIFTSYITKLT